MCGVAPSLFSPLLMVMSLGEAMCGNVLYERRYSTGRWSKCTIVVSLFLSVFSSDGRLGLIYILFLNIIVIATHLSLPQIKEWTAAMNNIIESVETGNKSNLVNYDNVTLIYCIDINTPSDWMAVRCDAALTVCTPQGVKHAYLKRCMIIHRHSFSSLFWTCWIAPVLCFHSPHKDV